MSSPRKDPAGTRGLGSGAKAAVRPWLLILLISLCLQVICNGLWAADQPRVTNNPSAQLLSSDPIQLIEHAYQAGTLTFDERAILIARAVRSPFSLPLAFRPQSLAEPKQPLGDPTAALKDIRVHWNQLSDSAQKFISGILTRWNTAFTYRSPSGFFTLHYDTVGSNAVPTADNDSDGIPDFVEHCAAYADSALHKHQLLGYILPPSDGTAGGDSTYDIYFENMLYYGYAQPESPGPNHWGDYTSYFVLHCNFLGFPPNLDPEGNQAGAAKVTCAHEFHHACQFAYNILNSPDWFTELDAVFTETVIFPKVNDNYNYLPDFFNLPEATLMGPYAHGASCFIWDAHLAKTFDTSLLVAVWQGERYKDLFTTMSDTLMGRYGWTQDSLMADFAVWNYCTGIHNDGLHYRDAANYPQIAIAGTYNSYPVLTQTSPTGPAGYGASYIQFVPNGSHGKLHVIFQGDESRTWAAYLIKSTSPNSHQFQKLSLNPASFAGTVDVYNFENYAAVTLVGINTSPNSTAANFTYSAEVRQPYALASTLVPDSALYSGATRQYKFTAKNVAPVADVIKTTWSDQAGWIARDSSSSYPIPGDSVVETVNVKPPVGTPLGSKSELRFRVISLNDSTIWAADTTKGTVVLQRGDVNFDGRIDLGDLSYLVSYLTGSGLPPIPVLEAGNFSCAGTVDLSDLTGLVAYLTGAGPRPPCNPF